MPLKAPSTFNSISRTVSASLITALIIGLVGIGYAFIDGKASKEELKAHCEDNKRVENAMYWQVGEQRSANNEKWVVQEKVNDKVDEKLDKIIEILSDMNKNIGEINGDNKAIKVEIKYLSGDKRKALSLINDSMFDEKVK